jgi:hypothetical protein
MEQDPDTGVHPSDREHLQVYFCGIDIDIGYAE